MTFLIASEPATPPAGAGDNQSSVPPLQLVRSGASPHSWSLPAGRCTVGSSAQCQIHLTDAGIRPLHCLIVHGAQETLITRWAANATLNGQDFSTAPLKPGDRLMIGSVELEVVGENPATPEKSSPPTAEHLLPTRSIAKTEPIPSKTPLVSPRRVEPQVRSANQERAKDPPAQWERDRLVRRLWSANYTSRSRCRQIIESLRTLRTESAQLDEQVKALRGQLHRTVDERERLAAELKQRQAQLDEREKQSTAELDRLISELTAAYERANVAEQAIAGQTFQSDELRNEIAVLIRERDQLLRSQIEEEQNRILLSEELADRDRTIDHLVRQLHDAQEASQRAADQAALLTAQARSLEEQVAAQQAQREQLAAEQANQAEQMLKLEQALADRDRTIAVLESQLSATALEVKSLQEQQEQRAGLVASLEAEVSRLHGERDDLIVDQSKRMNHLLELEQTLLDRDLAISHLETQVQETRAAAQAAQQNIADHVTRIESLTAEQSGQLAQLQEMGETIAARDQVIGQLERQLEEARHFASQSAQEQAVEFESRIQGLAADRDAIVAERASLSEQVQQLGETIAQRDHDVAEVQRQLTEAQQSASHFEQRDAESTSQIQSLEFEREALRAERTTLAGQIQELNDRVGERDRTLDQLRHELEEARAAARQVEEQSAKYVATIDELHAGLQQKEAQRDHLAAIQAEFAERRQQLEASLSERDHTIEELRGRLESASQAAREADERGAEQTAAVERLQRELDAERAEHQELAATHAGSADRISSLEQAVAERDRRQGEMEQGYASACNALQSLEKASFEQVEKCQRLEKQLADVSQERDALATVQSGHDNQLQGLRTTLEAREREVAELNEHLAAITERRAEAETEAYQRTEAYRLLEREVDELRSRCEATTGELTVGRVQHLELQQSIAKYEARVAELTSELEAAHQLQNDKQSSQESLARELAQVREEYVELQNSFDAERQRRNDEHQEVAKRNEKIELLEVDLRSVTSEYKQASEKLVKLHQERAAAEAQLATVERKLAESNERLDSLASGESRWADEREKLSAELEVARAEIAKLQEAATTILPEPAADFSAVLATAEDQKAELSRQLRSQEDEVARLAAELAAAHRQWEEGQAELQRFESLYKKSQLELAAAQEGLINAERILSQRAAPRVATPATHDQAEEIVEEGASAVGPAEPTPEPTPTPEFQPSSFIEQYSHMFEDDSAEPAPSSSLWETPTAKPQAIETASTKSLYAEPAHEESDDAALEAYMNNLMRRVRGDASDTAPPPTEPVRPVKVEPVEPVMPSWLASAPKTEPAEEVQEPLDMESLRMTSHKPPLATDIKALRELANTSARRAIAKHSKARYRERAVSKFLVCAAASGVAGYMMFTAESVQSPMFLAGLVPAVVGLRWGAKFLGVLLEAIRDGSSHKAHAAEMSIEDEALPIDGRAEK